METRKSKRSKSDMVERRLREAEEKIAALTAKNSDLEETLRGMMDDVHQRGALVSTFRAEKVLDYKRPNFVERLDNVASPNGGSFLSEVMGHLVKKEGCRIVDSLRDLDNARLACREFRAAIAPHDKAVILRLLKHMTCNADNSGNIAKEGGVAKAMAAMKAHPRVEDVQNHGCALVDVLNGTRKWMGDMTKYGADVVAAAMKEHPGSVGVQTNGCAAMCNLASCHNYYHNHARIMQAGGIEVVVAAMKAHLRSADVQQPGCKVLGYLARDHGNRVKITAAGGGEATVTAMKAHPDMENVQGLGCWVLLNMSSNPAIRGAMVPVESAAEAVVAAMKAHPSVALQRIGCLMLKNLAFDLANTVKIATAGAVEAALAAMKSHPGSVDVQRQGCGALLNLSRNSANKVKMTTAGVVEAMIAAMKSHPDSADIQQQGCRALQNMANDMANHPANKMKMVKAAITPWYDVSWV